MRIGVLTRSSGGRARRRHRSWGSKTCCCASWWRAGRFPERFQRRTLTLKSGEATYRFTVADHCQRDQVGVIINGAKRMAQRVSKLSSFVQRSRRLGCGVRADSSREGELLEESLHTFDVLRDVGVYLGIGALEVAVGEDGRRAVAYGGQLTSPRRRWTYLDPR